VRAERVSKPISQRALGDDRGVTESDEGERRAAASILEQAGPEVLFLFNRRLGPGRDGDINMLAVGPGGVYVVDVKRYVRATIQVRRIGGVFIPRRDQLFINGRDHTRLFDSLERQLAAVRAALASEPSGGEIPVEAAFCFVDARLPRRPASVEGIPLLDVEGTARLVAADGPLDKGARGLIHAHLAARLPPAD
jgi:hypothetical protein